jgi:hypothetical protein
MNRTDKKMLEIILLTDEIYSKRPPNFYELCKRTTKTSYKQYRKYLKQIISVVLFKSCITV